MPRSKSLDESQQQVVAEFAINHPDESDALVAARHGCSISQVRYAKKKAQAGELQIRRDHITDRLKADAIRATTDQVTLLDEQIHTVLAQLAAAPDMKVADRAAVLRTISLTKRTAQVLRLEAHMKNADAALICTLIRRFLPAATDDECITIYHEEVARCKASHA